uniref:WRKY transcription factor 41-like protein n=1 Tax=Isodon rubescens TaxID=587669 RepID=A0A6B9XUL3_ISORU|nr:WRKY transcription factor 41-like protein [Isodon rubescens]
MESNHLEEHESLLNELIKGTELAKDLAKQLRETSSSSSSERLVENILASYSEALSILSGRDTQGQCQAAISSSSDPPGSSISLCNVTQSKDSSGGSLKRKCLEDVQNSKIMKVAPDEEQSLISSSSDPPGSFISLCNVTQSEDSSSGLLKRKSWQAQTVKIGEQALDDGYNWRKYGQKDVLGSKYPRSYYRCAHRHTQGCMATKQVQRSDDDPTIYDVIYRGVHTCQARDLASKLAS